MKIFLSILLILPLITACASGPSKGQLDDEVRRLCAIDGGIKVYETVKLPTYRFDEYGQVRIPTKKRAKPEDEYYWDASRVFIRKGNPEMWKSQISVYRRVDAKLLGEAISYTRRGGDIPGPWHESSFMCPEKTDITDLKKQIFIKD